MSKISEASIIATVYNEEAEITKLLDSLRSQSVSPREVIISDGGSQDSTVVKLKVYKKKHPNFPLIIIEKKGNRSIGRNVAIEEAKSELIAITDAGCIPHGDWLEKLLAAQKATNSDVVAGYYEGKSQTSFEEAVIPYTLVMADRVDPNTFLPATRSMLIKKSAWENAGRFNENLADNEDYAFAKELEKSGALIIFAPEAVVSWKPRANLSSFYTMVYRFAKGDIFAGIIRIKVLLIFARYLLAAAVLLYAVVVENSLLIWMLGLAGIFYIAWSIAKNIRYVSNGWYWLPILQLFSDAAVMHGSLTGFAMRIKK